MLFSGSAFPHWPPSVSHHAGAMRPESRFFFLLLAHCHYFLTGVIIINERKVCYERRHAPVRYYT